MDKANEKNNCKCYNKHLTHSQIFLEYRFVIPVLLSYSETRCEFYHIRTIARNMYQACSLNIKIASFGQQESATEYIRRISRVSHQQCILERFCIKLHLHSRRFRTIFISCDCYHIVSHGNRSEEMFDTHRSLHAIISFHLHTQCIVEDRRVTYQRQLDGAFVSRLVRIDKLQSRRR